MDRNSRPVRARGATFSDRERYYRTVDETSRRGARSLLSGILALSLFLLVSTLSVRQATQPAPAQRALQAGIASLTDVDLLLAEQSAGLRREAAGADAAATYAIAGYPIDVFLTREEIVGSSTSELREIVLARSAVIVYARGLAAFDQTGRQSISLFSVEGLLDLVVARISKDTNDLASTLALVFAVVTALLSVALLSRGDGFGRLRALGTAVILGALPGLLLTLFVRYVALPRGSDPFVADLREVMVTLLGVPARNFLVVSILGVVLVLLSPATRLAARFLPQGPAPSVADPDWPEAVHNPIADLEVAIDRESGAPDG